MSWYEWGFEYNECTCKFCGESSEKEFCNKECAKAYKSEN